MTKLLGELLNRIKLNRSRLCTELYLPDSMLNQVNDWPGDFEGRGILSLCSLYHSFEGYEEEQNNVLKQLKEVFEKIEEHLNEYKYYGELLKEDVVDEQQISGNSWYLRGLTEYYKITKDPKYLEWLNIINKNYLLKLKPFYECYPIVSRKLDGGVSGNLEQAAIGKWKVSTDVGCAFMMLDGLTATYEILKDERLKELIDFCISKFLEIDIIELRVQTHATLSCSRGIFRLYKCTGEKKYLDIAMSLFDKYLKFGFTLDYSNINWFNRPDTWTEPCCVVDSMILAKKLYEETKDIRYLNLFNRIYINSIRTYQRDNGGAGCSTCAINSNYALKMWIYEAYYCCTMRIGEGFKEAQDFLCKKEGDTLFVRYPANFIYQDEFNEIEADLDIYNNKVIDFKFNRNKDIKHVVFYLPKSTDIASLNRDEEGLYHLDVKNETQITFKFNNKFNIEDGLVLKGDLLYTIKEEETSTDVYEYNGKKYSVLYDNSKFTESELKDKVQYVK